MNVPLGVRIQGEVWRSNASGFWLIEVQDLDLMTQGETKEEAYELMKAAIEEIVNEKGFKVEIHPESERTFTVVRKADGI